MIHQKQIHHNSCMATCLAMLAGLDVQHEDIEQAHGLLSSPGLFHMSSALEVFGIGYQRPDHPDISTLESGKVYLLCVPSLNIQGCFHQVIVDYRGQIPVVLDPAMGHKFKNYYVWGDPVSGLQVPLTSWIIDFVVTPHDEALRDAV